MVVDEDTLAIGPDRIFDFFLEYGIRHYCLIEAKPVNQPNAKPGTPTEHYVDPVRMGTFLARLYDRWLEHGDRGIRIRELHALQSRIQRRSAGICKLAGGCLGQYYLIEPDGAVAHCDLFLGDPQYTLGNLMQKSFAELRSSARMAKLREENVQALEAMRSCPEFPVCNGWCPHERYLSERHNRLHRRDCCGLRPLIEHIRGRAAEGAQAPEPQRGLLEPARRG